MSQKVVLEMETFNKLVDYVQRRPYAEVANLIDEIRQTAQVVENEQVSEEEAESDE